MLARIAPYLTAFLAVVVGLSLSAAPVPAAPQAFYVGIVILPDKEPAGYISIQNNQLRVAQTVAELESAKPTKAKNAQLQDTGRASTFQQFYEFPEVDVPVSTAGIAKVVVKLSFYRSRFTRRTGGSSQDRAGVYGELSLSRKDSSGTTWTYVSRVGEHNQPLSKFAGEHPLLLKVSSADPKSLKMDVTTKLEGRKARIGMQAKADGIDIYNVQKNGKNAPAKLEVTNKDGKHIVSEAGDPVKFGFT